jgi:Hemerythrin HHE cation binding domain
MTIIEQYPPLSPELNVDPTFALPFDVFRNVHKGIRAELFAVVGSAGSIDPHDRAGRAALSAHVEDVIALLVDHAEHEDAHVLPVLEVHASSLFERLVTDHTELDGRLARIGERSASIADAAPVEQRARVHNLYLDLASFSGAYLGHQEYEERVAMPALLDAIGIEGALGVHHSIVSSIPPAAMAKSLAVMIPAMNVEDRAEVLGAMQHDAPPEVFDAIWGLTKSVLPPADFHRLATRLGRTGQ